MLRKSALAKTLACILIGSCLSPVKAEQSHWLLSDYAALRHRASSVERVGDWKTAANLWNQAAEFARVNRLPTEDVASNLQNKAIDLLNLGEAQAAESEFQKALEIQQSFNGSDSPEVARLLVDLARAMDKENHHNEAQKLYRQALQIDSSHACGYAFTPKTQVDLAESLIEAGKLSAALPLVRSAIPDISIFGSNLDLSRAMHVLARLRIAEDSLEEGIALEKRAIEIARQDKGYNEVYVARCWETLGTAALTCGHYQDAVHAFKTLLGIVNRHPQMPSDKSAIYERLKAAEDNLSSGKPALPKGKFGYSKSRKEPKPANGESAEESRR